MTASPVNIRAHHAADRIRSTIYELEDNLDAKVLTPLRVICHELMINAWDNVTAP